MANNTQNVNVGKPKTTGAIYTAPLGTAVPTDPTSALADAFVCLGYISADGLTNDNSPESEDIKAWGGDTVYTTQTGKDDKYSFTMIESANTDVLKAVYGDDNVSEDNGVITVKANSKELTEHPWVVDMIMRGDTAKRIVIPYGKISETDTITYKDDEVIGYGVTLSCVPDEDGNTHYDYTQTASAASPTSLKATAKK